MEWVGRAEPLSPVGEYPNVCLCHQSPRKSVGRRKLQKKYLKEKMTENVPNFKNEQQRYRIKGTRQTKCHRRQPRIENAQYCPLLIV